MAQPAKTVHGIAGLDVVHSAAVIEGSEIKEYHVNVKIAFLVEPAD